MRSVEYPAGYNGPVRRVLIVFCGIIAVLAFLGVIWSFLLPQRFSKVILFPPELATRYGSYQIQVDSPKEIFLGERNHLVMWLLPREGSQPVSRDQSKGSYYFQSRLEIPGVKILPIGFQAERFDPVFGLGFLWELTGIADNDFEGTLKVYTSQETSLAPGESGEMIFAIPITISVRRVLGMPVDVARMVAILIIAISALGILAMVTKGKTKLPTID
jgi:hypothetical protein